MTAGRAQILADFGRGPEALALLERAATAYPDRAELRYARATVLEQSGAVDAALGELRAVARQRPLDPTAQNALGFTLADHGRELAEAERRIRAALAERPDSAAIKDSLGWVLHRRGRSGEGLDWRRPRRTTHVAARGSHQRGRYATTLISMRIPRSFAPTVVRDGYGALNVAFHIAFTAPQSSSLVR